jgi:hypothetical protein
MTFFYDLNKRLAALAEKQDAKQIAKDVKASAPKSQLAESLDEAGYSAKAARAGKDIGKPGKTFAKIAKSAGERYGSKERGEKVAGAVLAKLRAKESVEEADDHKETKLIRDLRAQGLSDKQIVRKMEQIKRGTTKTVAKEADMEEGNAFTGALAKTPKGGKFKVGSKEFTDTSSLEEGSMKRQMEADAERMSREQFCDKYGDEHGEFWDNIMGDLDEGFKEMHAWLAQREKEKGTGKFDKKEISTGTVYTRKPETFDEPETDDDTPKKVGRKTVGAGKGKKLGAKHSGRSKLASKSAIAEEIPVTDRGEYDDEAGMAKDSLHTIVRSARELENALRSNENLPEWVQEKIGQIKGMMSSVTDYMLSTHERDAEEETGREGITIGEKAVSVAQRRAAGIAHAAQKGEIPKSKLRGASKEMAKMDKSELHKFAATKEKDLPKKVKEAGKPDFLDLDKDGDKKEPMKKAAKEKTVDETTTAGSVATAPAVAKSSKGMQFGQGVYEGFNTKVENMISEGMSVTVNMSAGEEGEPRKSINVVADGEDADKLAELLKMAGLEHKQEACPACGHSPCDCEEELDENSPDWPTNTETLEAEPNLRTYSGGLNGPKSTGQTTIPVVASQLRRQASMEEGVKLERTLSTLYKNYKAK